MLHDQRAVRVAVIGGSRIPFCRSHGAYRHRSNQDLMTAALKGLVEKFELKGEAVGDVSLGAVIKHSKDFNLARESVIGSGLSLRTPGFDVQRACGTSLEATISIANKIALGQIDVGIAGGTDSISDAPIVYNDDYRRVLMDIHAARSTMARLKAALQFRPRHLKPVLPGVEEPRTGLSMGASCELMAKQWQLTREEQDQLAMASHLNAAAAQEAGWYQDLITPFEGVERDNNVRPDASMESLGKLKPSFDRSGTGTMTAGNSTPLTDGASSVLLASEDWARDRGLPVMAYLSFARVAAVDFLSREGLLMAPAYAVSDMLRQADLALQDFDFYEIHEAFAAQTLATLRAWESEEYCRERLGRDAPLGTIDRALMNTKGGSVAIGHPFGATGARIVGTLAKLLHEKGTGRGLISVCTSGGMGVSAIMEAA